MKSVETTGRRAFWPILGSAGLAGWLILSASTGLSKEKSACKTSGASTTPASLDVARIGEKAPDFTLKSVNEKSVSLSDFKGKVVVLEWFNPGCPFVNLAHNRGLSLKGKAGQYKGRGVVWLAVNSNGPGKQGYGKEANKAGKNKFGIPYPILLDPTGKVGKQYGAIRTPELFVIDENGVLVYRGAVDNTRGGDVSDADPPPARNFVDEVLASVLRKDLPVVRETTAWGCTVKYAD